MPTQDELSASIPARVEGYVRALGAREAAAFLTRFGGKVIHIPAKPKAGSALTRAIGVEKATALKDVFGHGTIKVPMGRAWVARQLDAEGMSRAEIAKKLLVTRESVRLYLSTPKNKAA